MMRSILTLLLAAAAIVAGSNVYAMPDIGPGPGPRGGGWQTAIDIGPGPGPRGGGWHSASSNIEDVDLICDCADLFKGTKG